MWNVSYFKVFIGIIRKSLAQVHGEKLKEDAVNKNYVLGYNTESNFK